MKRIINLCLLLLFFASVSTSCQILDKAKKILKEQTSGAITEEDAVAGIKEALINGTTSGVEVTSKIDGYFKNPQIKIPFPKEAGTIEERLRAMGFGNKVDEVVLTINRAAEDAAVAAKPIFISAIKKMTVKDALNIVKGEKTQPQFILKIPQLRN